MKEEVRQAIIALSEVRKGQLTAEELYEAAKDPLHPAHDEFEWDPQRAAFEYNLSVARRLIRAVRVEVRITEFLPQRRVPLFAPNPDKGVGGYETLDSIRQDEDRARAAAVREFREAARYLRRACQVAIELGFSGEEIDKTVRLLLKMADRASGAGAAPLQ